MNNSKYSVKIFGDFENEELKNAWQRLEKENDVFPQMYYEWIEPWWRYQKKNRKLHIITVLAENNEIVGIAPFCIERIYGVKVLRSIPIHFGDFYDFILEKENEKKLYSIIFDYLQSFVNWHVIQINQVNTNYEIYNNLIERKDVTIDKTADILKVDIYFDKFNDFLESISSKERKHYRRRIRRLNEIGKLELKVIKEPSEYLKFETVLNQMYIKRWGNSKEKEYKTVFKYRTKSFCSALLNKKAIGFILLIDNKPIAYRLGFLHSDEFISWKLVYDPDYSKLGVGNLISLLSIESLILNKTKYLNLGAGVYDYKLNWFNSQIIGSLNTTFLFKRNIFSFSYVFFMTKIKKYVKVYLKYGKNLFKN